MYRIIYLALAVIFLIIAYPQVFVLHNFNTETVKRDRVKIELSPESQPAFAGFDWGLLRFDSKDELILGVVAHIGVGKVAKISLLKDGNTFDVICSADSAGICYDAIHQPEVKISGVYTCIVTVDGSSFSFTGTFERRREFVFLLREALLSV